MPAASGRLAALVLAAGSASRLGSRPKCLLELDGVPLLRRLVDALVGAAIDDVTVVLGHYADRVAPALAGAPVRVVINPQPQDGQTASLRVGLAALPDDPIDVMVALADQPGLEAPDLAALYAAWQHRPGGLDVLVPRVAGQRGNPVVMSARVRRELLAAPADMGARQWQVAHPRQVGWFDSDNAHFCLDVDTGDDLERFQRLTGRSLAWPPGLSAGPPGR